MSGIGSLTGWDRSHLIWASSMGIEMLIKHHTEIERVAERFCTNDINVALYDIFEKGLQEMLDMCDMDDKLSETEAQMQNPMNGIVTSFRGGL